MQERALADLLTASGVAPRGVTYFNLAAYERPGRSNPKQDDQFRTSALASLQQQDAVILASAASDDTARQIARSGVYVVNVANLPTCAESTAYPLADDGGPRPIRAVFTGMAPVVERTQRQLLGSLQHGLVVAVALVTGVVTLAFMSAPAGLLTMLPAAFPLLAVLGVMGWLGLPINLGITMTAGVALGLAVEGAVHFVNWFRLGMATGMPRPDAVRHAYARTGAAMLETTLIAGACLAVLGLSAFTPIRQFGGMMIAMLVASTAGNLLLLPAILASPLGWFFAPLAIRRQDPLLPRVQAMLSRKKEDRSLVDPELLALPQTTSHAPRAPHYPSEPAPVRRTPLSLSNDERRELAEGPHSALHAKLQSLRRPRTGESPEAV